MEHSLLHGFQLCGLIFALGGALFRLLILAPVARRLPVSHADQLRAADGELSRWVLVAAVAGGFAAGIDILVQVAELQGKTIYGPVDFTVLARYLSLTTVGRLALLRCALLLAMALVVRMAMPLKWWIAAGLGVAAALVASMVSHAAAVPAGRSTVLVAQFLHIVAAALWLGMLGNVLIVTAHVIHAHGENAPQIVGQVVNRFSPFALATAIILLLSGLFSTMRFLLSPASMLVSPYGLTLLVKLTLLTLVLYPAFVNWQSIRPALLAAENSATAASPVIRRFLRLLELELTAGILVITIAGIVGAISPPGADGSARLTARQVEALLSPKLPPTGFSDPKQFVGALDRTEEDMRYAEFTHTWSGAFVIALGLCWLGQSVSGRRARAFAKFWPILLIPFGIFIAAIADPEVWILRSLSLTEALQNAQILEHQVGAVLVFVLVFLGFRDSRRPAEQRPLGYALPIVMIAGSLMLLGHAHTSLGASEELGTLINVEHAVFGAFGLFGGLLRWLQLRQLLPARFVNYLWPGCVIGLGLFMAFFYREIY